jgi:hypothetical protein
MLFNGWRCKCHRTGLALWSWWGCELYTTPWPPRLNPNFSGSEGSPPSILTPAPAEFPELNSRGRQWQPGVNKSQGNLPTVLRLFAARPQPAFEKSMGMSITFKPFQKPHRHECHMECIPQPIRKKTKAKTSFVTCSESHRFIFRGIPQARGPKLIKVNRNRASRTNNHKVHLQLVKVPEFVISVFRRLPFEFQDETVNKTSFFEGWT